jgi:integrase
MKIYDFIEDMLRYKESLGYLRSSYSGYLQGFKHFLLNHYPDEGFLTQSIMLEWCQMKETEVAAGFRKRAGVLREFSKYLFSINRSECILSLDFIPKNTRYTPYIFTDKELVDFFSASDCVAPTKNSPNREIIIPVIFRLIYFCGLRPNEGREILRKDVDLDDGTIIIRTNKSNRERKIPLSEDIKQLCKKYSEQLAVFQPNSDYFFPSPKGKPYSKKWLRNQFYDLWQSTKPSNPSQPVRVYDLRHRYATAVMMKWVDEKADLSAMLPYLSAYMGHVNFSDTAYYIHLLPENLLQTDGVNWENLSSLIPRVMEDE